jgi:hypothetical protein
MTTPGRWATLSSAVVFVLLFLNPLIVKLVSLAGGQDLTENRTLFSIIGILLVAFAAGAVVTGALAIVRFKERSMLVILGTVFNFVYLLFAIDTILI